MPKVRGRSLRVLFDAESIAARNLLLAGEIAAAGYKNLLVVSILKGSFVFAADLIRALHGAGLAPEVEFISLSSYKTGTTSTGKVITGKRVYHPCYRGRLPHTIPKL